ncbi:MAG: hypothetical protein HFH46_00730 [Bacilli bacterium]|nr:hypothetical protein [Bacilli bacterium]
MNILFEIADRDLILFGFILTTVILLGIIIFWAVNKGKIVLTEEIIEEPKLEKPELTEEQKAAKAELERVFNQMSADLEAKNESQPIETFEREQEENAIISYQELIKQVEKKQEIKKEQPAENIEESKPEIEKIEQMELDFEEPKKFKNSDIISPIFGIQKENNYQKKPKEEKIEEPFVARHAYESIKKDYEDENNKDFLNSLKEFRKNL